MTRLLGAVALVGLALWIIADPTVLTELAHALFCRCLDHTDAATTRRHADTMDALQRVSRGDE